MRLGNTKGWVIAGVLLVVEVVGVSYALTLDRATPPTALVSTAGAMEPIAFPVDPRTIVATDQPGDAGTLYRAAVTDYLANVGLYERFVRDRERTLVTQLTAVDKLLQATHLTGRTIYADAPNEVIVYGESMTVQALERLGQAAIGAGPGFERRQPDRAKQYYAAAFSLGMRMAEERLTWRQFNAGLRLMSNAAASMNELAKKSASGDASASLVSFMAAQDEAMRSRWLPLAGPMHTTVERDIAIHAGDVFAFATDSRERMWRVEAILKLGRMRYNVGIPPRPADQRHAERLLRRMAQSETDPVIRRAVTAAQELTIEGFRTIR